MSIASSDLSAKLLHREREPHLQLAVSDVFWQLWPSSIATLGSGNDKARAASEQCNLSLSILTKFLEKDLEQSKLPLNFA